MGELKKVIWYYQLSWQRKLATVKSFKTDVSSVSPSSEEMRYDIDWLIRWRKGPEPITNREKLSWKVDIHLEITLDFVGVIEKTFPVSLQVCCNFEPHLRGNVYVQFSR